MTALNFLDALEATLQHHGVRTARSGSRLLLPDHGCHFETKVAASVPREQGHMIRLDVTMTFADGRFIQESFAGLGSDVTGAQRDAFDNFLRSSFHVLLRAFLVPEDDEQVTIEEWQIDGQRYVAIIGGIVARGSQPAANVPFAWFRDLEAAIKANGPLQPTNWIRFYYAHMSSSSTAVEVLLNNEPWPAVAEAMANVDWPKSGPFYSVRLFLVLSAVNDHALQ